VEIQTSEKECAPKVELKPPPSHLKHEFLNPDSSFPIIVNAKLDGAQLEKWLDIPRKHRGAIGY